MEEKKKQNQVVCRNIRFLFFSVMIIILMADLRRY
jgi:hypothetical protein